MLLIISTLNEIASIFCKIPFLSLYYNMRIGDFIRNNPVSRFIRTFANFTASIGKAIGGRAKAAFKFVFRIKDKPIQARQVDVPGKGISPEELRTKVASPEIHNSVKQMKDEQSATVAAFLNNLPEDTLKGFIDTPEFSKAIKNPFFERSDLDKAFSDFQDRKFLESTDDAQAFKNSPEYKEYLEDKNNSNNPFAKFATISDAYDAFKLGEFEAKAKEFETFKKVLTYIQDRLNLDDTSLLLFEKSPEFQYMNNRTHLEQLVGEEPAATVHNTLVDTFKEFKDRINNEKEAFIKSLCNEVTNESKEFKKSEHYKQTLAKLNPYDINAFQKEVAKAYEAFREARINVFLSSLQDAPAFKQSPEYRAIEKGIKSTNPFEPALRKPRLLDMQQAYAKFSRGKFMNEVKGYLADKEFAEGFMKTDDYQKVLTNPFYDDLNEVKEMYEGFAYSQKSYARRGWEGLFGKSE